MSGAKQEGYYRQIDELEEEISRLKKDVEELNKDVAFYRSGSGEHPDTRRYDLAKKRGQELLKQLEASQKDEMACTGCGRRQGDKLPPTALACCPDHNYVTASEMWKHFVESSQNGLTVEEIYDLIDDNVFGVGSEGDFGKTGVMDAAVAIHAAMNGRGEK